MLLVGVRSLIPLLTALASELFEHWPVVYKFLSFYLSHRFLRLYLIHTLFRIDKWGLKGLDYAPSIFNLRVSCLLD